MFLFWPFLAKEPPETEASLDGGIFVGGLDTGSHRIHVWFIYLHLVDTVHGSDGGERPPPKKKKNK